MDLLPLLHVNLVPYLVTLLVFFTLLIVLGKFAWTPILQALDERDDQIRTDLDQAENARKSAEELMQQHKNAMSELKAEAQKIREEAKELGNREKSQIIETARREAESLLENAKAEIEREKLNALEDVKTLAVDVGVGLAEKLLAKEIGKDGHGEIIAASISDLEKAYQ